MGLTLITPPAFYPLTLEEIKAHCKDDGSAEDTMHLSNLIAATEYVQKKAGRQLITASYCFSTPAIANYGDCFFWAGTYWPMNRYNHFNSGGYSLGRHRWRGARIELPKAPVQSVTSIQYYDANNALQTLSTSKYRVGTDTEPAYVIITDIPAMYDREDAIKINFTSGYGNQEDVPEHLRLAIRLLCGEWFRNREATAPSNMVELAIGVESLIGLDGLRQFK